MSNNAFEQMPLDFKDLGEKGFEDNGGEPEDVRNGAYMFVVRVEGDNVSATPVIYSMGEEGAEPVEDAPEDPNVFYQMVAEDMGDLLVQLVARTEESGMSKSEAMLQLLTDMQQQPQELIHNMLATIIVEAANDES